MWAVSNLDVSTPIKLAASPFQYECSFVSWGNIDGHNPIDETQFDYDFGGINSQAPWYEGQVYGSTPGAALSTDIPLSLDIAHRELGGPWRMPSSEEFQELIANCSFVEADGETIIPSSRGNKLVTVNGVTGIYLKSNSNGNLLFMACCGGGINTELRNRGSGGYYWSASFLSARDAYELHFNSDRVRTRYSNNRFYGRPIRPVWLPGRR